MDILHISALQAPLFLCLRLVRRIFRLFIQVSMRMDLYRSGEQTCESSHMYVRDIAIFSFESWVKMRPDLE
jgi:hypothetical protein